MADYYPALDALWMLQNHGMTFEGPLHDPRETLRHYCLEPNLKFYPDPAGIALLTPRPGDDAAHPTTGEIRRVIADDDEEFEMSEMSEDIAAADHYVMLSEAVRDGYRTIMRDGKAFIQPMREAAA